jgi:hypothetical protein
MNINLTFDAKHVLKKWSTWLSLMSASSTAGLLAYGALPQGGQDAFPHLILTILSTLAVAGPLLIPLATSIQQGNIPAAPEAPSGS